MSKTKVNTTGKKNGGIIVHAKTKNHRHFKRDADRAVRKQPKQQRPKPEGFA